MARERFVGWPAVCAIAIFVVAAGVIMPVVSAQTPEPVSSGSTTAAALLAASSTEQASTTVTTPTIELAQVQPYIIESISGNGVAIGDFVVGPGRMEVEVKPGETVTKMITVTNRIADNKKFSLTVEDMSGSADASEAVVLLGDQSGPYTLKDNITFPNDTFDLDLNERAQVLVTITMPPNAEPGGYYGAVLVSTIQSNTEEVTGTTARSPIIARIGTLFFITVPGEAEVSGTVTDFAAKNNQWWFEKGPIELGVLFENTGSVHLNPYGEIQINNMLGESVGFVELEPWFVLPKSLRLREVTWDRELLFGRYTITAKVNRGYDNVIDEKTIHIWVMPWKLLLVIFVGLVIIIGFIRFILTSFEFKRKGT